MAAYYNENEPFAAAWLRELIKGGIIAYGEVDERSIVDVQPGDLAGYDQCHFFAGCGGWSYALRLAGWPDDRPCWTGSAPCQPFSNAGKGRGTADERHLWPAFFNLIRERHPDVVFGEQVEAAIGHGWLDLVFADLEGEDYACGAAVLGAHSVGAPHIRQRLYWVANANRVQHEQAPGGARGEEQGARRVGDEPAGDAAAGGGAARGLGDRDSSGQLQGEERNIPVRGAGELALGQPSEARGLGHAKRDGFPAVVQPGGTDEEGRMLECEGSGDAPRPGGLGDADDVRSGEGGRNPLLRDVHEGQAGESGSPWDACEWLPCLDGKVRAIEPGLLPLADGVPERASKLRAYGNAVVPQTAAAFVRAFAAAARRRS